MKKKQLQKFWRKIMTLERWETEENKLIPNFFGLGNYVDDRGNNVSSSACAPSEVCNPTDYSPPGSSVHGIFLARILERVAPCSVLANVKCEISVSSTIWGSWC